MLLFRVCFSLFAELLRVAALLQGRRLSMVRLRFSEFYLHAKIVERISLMNRPFSRELIAKEVLFCTKKNLCRSRTQVLI